MSNSKYKTIYQEGTAQQKELLEWRYRIQQVHSAARKLGATANSTEEINNLNRILNVLSVYHWVDNDFHSIKIGLAVGLLRDETLFGDDISNKARILRERWDRGDFTPGPIEDLFDDDAFSSDTGEDFDSADEDVVRSDAYRDIMRGINVVTSATGRKTYMLDRHSPKKAADITGSNGLTVGDWWPYQICALRDGAHGSRMGGIHGRVNSGAFSIVISGGYEDTDKDYGTRILYSGSRGEIVPNQPQVAPLTNATKSLIKSSQTQNPIRVLRSSKCASRYAPAVGIRYDGLYHVVNYDIQNDPEGKPYYQFELERIRDQDRINQDRPSEKERKEFVLVTGG